ncbi:MAG: hypothetical protein ACYC25_14905, partial [Paludibacter sp.]
GQFQKNFPPQALGRCQIPSSLNNKNTTEYPTTYDLIIAYSFVFMYYFSELFLIIVSVQR